jgi:hypothetical protein
MRSPVDIDEYAKRLPLDLTELKEQHLSEDFINRIQRLRSLYTYWLQFPNKRTEDLVQYDEQMFHIRKTQAYEDIQLTKILIGDLLASTKEFWRWRINTMILEDHKAARRANDWRSAASMQKNLILNNKTDKDDPIDLEFDKIVPQNFEMTDNITILIPNAKKTPRKKIEDLLRKYGKRDDAKIEDADFVEVHDDQSI